MCILQCSHKDLKGQLGNFWRVQMSLSDWFSVLKSNTDRRSQTNRFLNDLPRAARRMKKWHGRRNSTIQNNTETYPMTSFNRPFKMFPRNWKIKIMFGASPYGTVTDTIKSSWLYDKNSLPLLYRKVLNMFLLAVCKSRRCILVTVCISMSLRFKVLSE